MSINNPFEEEKEVQPTLTLDPFAQPEPEIEVKSQPIEAQQPAAPKPVFDESMLSEQEKKMVDDFAA